MLTRIKRLYLPMVCLGLLSFGQPSLANEPPLMDWYKMVAPNYVQFQQVYGKELDGTVFAQMFRPSHEQTFSDKKLTSEQIRLGVALSEEAYYHCMIWGYHRLTAMFGDDDIDKVADDILTLCQDHEDVYDIYNILLASDHYGFEMTEYQARQRILENAQKGTRDNSDFHQAVRKRVYQLKEQSLGVVD